MIHHNISAIVVPTLIACGLNIFLVKDIISDPGYFDLEIVVMESQLTNQIKEGDNNKDSFQQPLFIPKCIIINTFITHTGIHMYLKNQSISHTQEK